MVPSLDEITAIENEYAPPSGKPTLGEAYAMLQARWAAGLRDVETGLRFMFLAWYSCCEPPCLTGLSGTKDDGAIFGEVFAHYGGTASTDAELLCATGFMSALFPWCCGNEAAWSAIAVTCKLAARRMKPEGFPPEHFQGRGAYGDYFAQQARGGGLSEWLKYP